MGLETFVRRLHHRIQEPDCSIVWFLGAGCSISSGIPGAGALVNEWLRKLKQLEDGSDDSWEIWAAQRFESFDPANPAFIYGPVIEELFMNLERDRQQEVERLIVGKDPAVGYALLARLMAHPEFGERGNTVLTTNFDDLVADALYLLTNKKPLVVVHDSLAPFVRQSRSRPLIVKVHGDARLAPRNTPDETILVDKELTHRLSSIMQSCALVFCGYAGNDHSIAGLIDSASFDAFPLGIYWVGSEMPSGPLAAALGRRHRVFHIAHQDFDALMLTIAEVFNLTLPDDDRFRTLFDGYRTALAQRAAITSGAGGLEREAASRLGERIDVWTIVRKAKALESMEPQRANEMYLQAVEAAPTSAPILGTYALFLNKMRGEMDRTEEFYKRAIDADPNNAVNLGNYAIFLKDVRGEMDRAEELYKRAIDADPNNAVNLGNYALVLKDVRGEMDRAEEFYKRAIDADPDHANNLGNYAVFLKDVRGEMDRAEEFYKRAIDADPDHANSLGNYALFLEDVRGETDRAEELYKRAIDADPDHANSLGNYAVFLDKVRGETDRAEEFYKRAIDADPDHANNLGNYAQRLFAQTADSEASQFVERALKGEGVSADLRLEVNFYLYAHVPSSDPASLATIREMLKFGDRSRAWDFSPNLARTQREGDSRLSFLQALADVISDKAPLETLESFPEWSAGHTKQ
jgi:Tfp pilus assembly protein PilF